MTPALLMLALCAGPAPVQADGADTAAPGAGIRAVVLDGDPRDLPHAAEDRWADWSPDVLPPDVILPTFQAAVRAYTSGALPVALGHLWTVLSEHPDYPPALHQMGVIYFRLRRYGDAVHVLERFFARAPDEVAETRALAHSYYSLGRYDDALRHYARVLAAQPGMVEALRGIALAHMRLGDAAQALEYLERVIALAPDHADAWAWRARLLFDEDRTGDALAAAERARDLDAFEPRPWFLLAQILYELERDEDAAVARRRFEALDRVAQETRALEAQLLYDPNQPEVLKNLARYRGSVGDVPRTRKALQRLMRIDARRTEWNVFALDVLEGIGDEDGAAVVVTALETNCAGAPETWKRLERYYGRLRHRVKQVQAGERYRLLSGTDDH